MKSEKFGKNLPAVKTQYIYFFNDHCCHFHLFSELTAFCSVEHCSNSVKVVVLYKVIANSAMLTHSVTDSICASLIVLEENLFQYVLIKEFLAFFLGQWEVLILR